MTLTVRSATVNGATTKGSALTHAELDENWNHVANFTPSGSGARARDLQGKVREIVSATDFENADTTAVAPLGSARINTTGLQRALDAMGARTHGGTVYVPNPDSASSPADYHSGQLTLPYKVSIEGPANARSVSGTATITLAANTNAALIVNDQTNGPSQGTGIDGGTQRSQVSTIWNIALRGNAANQTSIDADVLRFTNAWYIDLKGVLIVSAKGFGIRALDCNVLHITGCHGFDAPIFWESVADSVFLHNEWGGGQGPAYPVFWMAEANCWKNSIGHNFIYNNANNTAITQPTFTSDSGGTSHILTTNAAHGWTDKTPVIVTTTSALPAGLSANVVYYVKVLSTTTVRLATSRANLDAGTFVNVSGAGTGTQTIGVGRNAGLYLSTGVKWNTFTANRFDQHYGHGILLGGATENTFTANTITENGLANVTGQSGIKLESATKNKFDGNLIDGTVITVGANNTNQTIGIEGDSGSTGNVILDKPHDHSTANIQMAAGYTTTELTDELFIPYTAFPTTVTGTQTVALDAGNRRNMLTFPDAETGIRDGWVLIPKGWTSATPSVVWVNAGAGSGNVVWRVQGHPVIAGETLNAVDSTGDSGGDPCAAGARDVVTVNALTALTFEAGDYFSIRVSRLGADGSDDLTNAAGLLGVKLVRA